MPRQSREVRQALAKTPPLRVGGADLVEGADRIMRTPAEHQAQGVSFKVARIYMRVSTDEQDLSRPPRQNTCRSHRTLNPGAMMEEQVGEIRTSIQGQSRGAVAAA